MVLGWGLSSFVYAIIQMQDPLGGSVKKTDTCESALQQSDWRPSTLIEYFAYVREAPELLSAEYRPGFALILEALDPKNNLKEHLDQLVLMSRNEDIDDNEWIHEAKSHPLFRLQKRTLIRLSANLTTILTQTRTGTDFEEVDLLKIVREMLKPVIHKRGFRVTSSFDGALDEIRAAADFVKRGYRIQSMRRYVPNENCKGHASEIDIVLHDPRKKNSVIFVEVKRSLRSIHPEKRSFQRLHDYLKNRAPAYSGKLCTATFNVSRVMVYAFQKPKPDHLELLEASWREFEFVFPDSKF